MTYNHTQIGYLMIVIDIVLVFYLMFLMYIRLEIITTIAVSVVILLLASFTTLSVKVDHDYVRLKYGYGIFRKKFSTEDIVSAKAVKNKWYYGWGIRYVFWEPFWLYNVSGFYAVEIKMANGKINRIGTDEPKKLEYAVKEVIR